ncbi:MAG TPA: M20/M25/M40 family metallo-hydrolase [Bryobacteraceae bacterium]|nr:M20/M25/M40 family metallo-hydrolase [Bryobacteraceae bacterium]
MYAGKASAATLFLAVLSATNYTSAQNILDDATLKRMHREAFYNSQADAVFGTLTAVIGPRLTASPAHKRAAEYTKDVLAKIGLTNARLEPWHFGRGWSLERQTIEMIEPRYLPLLGYADAWSASTKGEIVATPVMVAGKTPEQIAAMGPALKGAIVLTMPTVTNFIRKDRPQPSDPAYVPNSAAFATNVRVPGLAGPTRVTPIQQLSRVLSTAGAGVLISPSRGEHGTVFVTGRDGGPGAAPSLALAGEHYNMIVDMLSRNIVVKLRVNIDSRFYDDDQGNAYNVLAELPGADPSVREEVVMIGAHLDSWHTGTGATDNADGVTTVIEAMRIIKDAGLHPRRTIRVALWGGEEQGLLGSKAWVQQHLMGDQNAAARRQLNVYFNIDNGTGPIYGWYAQNDEKAKSVFDRWLEPLKEYGARRNTLEPIGSTDHLSFIGAGVPGFNPIQDYTNYDVRTHHTNMDTADRLNVTDIREAALMMAAFAYNASITDAPFPRQSTK